MGHLMLPKIIVIVSLEVQHETRAKKLTVSVPGNSTEPTRTSTALSLHGSAENTINIVILVVL
jgi:hypothetical protein